jgi:death-on-curing family protein
MYNIIANHIFQDGNKRTGLEAAIVFLRINGLNISQNLELVRNLQLHHKCSVRHDSAWKNVRLGLKLI